MLCLKAESCVFPIDCPFLADDGTIQSISRIKLDTGIGRVYLQHPSACRARDACGKAEIPWGFVENVAVVEAVNHRTHYRAQTNGTFEIKRSPLHCYDLPRWDQGGVRLRIVIRLYPKDVVVYSSRCVAIQIEKRMIRDVNGCWLIRVRFVVHPDFILICERIPHIAYQVPWISLIAILAAMAKLDALSSFNGHPLRVPYDLIEPLAATVQVMSSLVSGQLVRRSGEGKPRVTDPIGISPYKRTEIRIVACIVFWSVVSEHNVRKVTVSVGDVKRHEDATICHDLSRKTVAVCQREYGDLSLTRILFELLLPYQRGPPLWWMQACDVAVPGIA